MKKTLSITVYNESGVLTRISTVFSSRGFNIESIAVGPTENYRISKIIIVSINLICYLNIFLNSTFFPSNSICT